jgi:chromosome segregation ATPase
MWRLRRKTERGWYDGFHIHTGEEAKGLCETLNKLERELNEAREVLKITQEAWVKAKAERVEALRERDEAREQGNDMREKWLAKGQCCEYLGAELHEAIKQRDRLAAALRSIKNELGVPQPEYPAPVANAVKIADEALQSLTQKP